jgi:hypothetical protein
MMQKKGDGKKHEKMVEENPPKMLQKQVDNLAKAIETLTGKLENPPKTEYSRGGSMNLGLFGTVRERGTPHRKMRRRGLSNKMGAISVFQTGKRFPGILPDLLVL